MSARAIPPPPPEIPCSPETLSSYSELDNVHATVFYPRDAGEVARLFEYAKGAKRRVTLRAGGHSFDAQSLNCDLVVSLKRMDRIQVFPDQRRIRVGPGATWGAIVALLEPHGLVPAVTVTTAHATAGGTLSGDCLSRFSPAFGKEGRWIESFELLTPEGTLLNCTRPGQGAWTLEQRAFVGAIGGLGYLGAVVAITYKVLHVGETRGRIGVRTRVGKFTSFDHLADYLAPQVQTMARPSAARAPLADEPQALPSNAQDYLPEEPQALYSALTTRGSSREALVFTSSWTPSPERERMLLNRPNLWVRVLVEWLIRSESLNGLLWWYAFRYGYRNWSRYLDDLEGFTFFMDGNVHAKRVARRFGVTLKTIQQSFVVPADRSLVAWLEYGHALLQERRLQPTLLDVIYLPQDLPFPLSATADSPGFVVSYGFETNRAAKLEKVADAFRAMSDHLLKEFGGKVYLVKNVRASEQTIADMYGANASSFFALKDELDPAWVLCNAWLETTFRGLLPDGCRRARDAGP